MKTTLATMDCGQLVFVGPLVVRVGVICLDVMCFSITLILPIKIPLVFRIFEKFSARSFAFDNGTFAELFVFVRVLVVLACLLYSFLVLGYPIYSPYLTTPCTGHPPVDSKYFCVKHVQLSSFFCGSNKSCWILYLLQ
jgi:hypothetical protein